MKNAFGTWNRCTNPTILHSLLPALAILANTHDDIKTIVTGVQTLSMTLRAVPDQGKGIIFEVVLELGQWPVTPLVDDLFAPGKVEGLHPTNRTSLLMERYQYVTRFLTR